ncbi:MAG: sterol desaturase family protein [Bacteroidota bacterium]
MMRWLNVKQPEPERYFQSDFLERFTFFRLRTVWIIWAPIALFSLFGSFYVSGKVLAESSFLLITAGILLTTVLGILRWSLLEYFLHRFPFHYDGPKEWGRKTSWYIHGIHHKQAMLSTRLVAPPLFSLAVGTLIALLDWLFLGFILGAGWIGLALYAGTAFGYLIYDTLHWSVHFIDTDWPWYRKLRSHHMRHHRFPHGRFGVSNTLWDHVFRTYPKSKEAEETKAREASSPTD